MNIEQWQSKLSNLITLSIDEWGKKHKNIEVSMFAVDCHPWSGFLSLALLTQSEVDEDKLLANSEEMAAWEYFNFSEGYKVWLPSKKLAVSMQEEWSASANIHFTSEKYFIACASAVGSDLVSSKILDLKRSVGFVVSVANPDNNKEYCSLFVQPLTFEQAQQAAENIAVSELEKVGLNCPENILSQTYVENEGCWIFFMNEVISHVSISTDQLFWTAYAIAKSGEMSHVVYDFRSDQHKMKEYADAWSLQALGLKAEAKTAMDTFLKKHRNT